MNESNNVKLTVALNNSDQDAEEIDQLTRNLLQEMKDIDEVEQVGLVAVEETPTGSKALGGVILGLLQAEVSISGLKTLMGYVGNRCIGKPIEMEVEANGKKLKVKASNQEELLGAIQAAQQFIASV